MKNTDTLILLIFSLSVVVMSVSMYIQHQEIKKLRIMANKATELADKYQRQTWSCLELTSIKDLKLMYSVDGGKTWIQWNK